MSPGSVGVELSLSIVALDGISEKAIGRVSQSVSHSFNRDINELCLARWKKRKIGLRGRCGGADFENLTAQSRPYLRDGCGDKELSFAFFVMDVPYSPFDKNYHHQHIETRLTR